MSAHPKRRLTALLLASALVWAGALGAHPAAAAPVVLDDPDGAALDWIEGELATDGGSLSTSFQGADGEVTSFPDWGLTIDAILALSAGGRGGGAAATVADDLVEDNVASYVTGGEFGPDDRYAGAFAKTLLMAQVQGEDPTDFGGFDLVTELLARLQAEGADLGRFSDQTGFGDFSNGFGQALAIMGLARTGAGAPSSAVDFLLDQQCPGGSFRGDYTTPGGCTSDEDATVDATGFALQALLTVEPTCPVRQAIADATASLVEGQAPSGAFGGESGSNTNSTGLAAVALRSLGVAKAPDAAASFIAGLQLDNGEDIGAIALDQSGLASAGDGIQGLERDGFRRATTQAVLAFGLPTYGEIGADPVDPRAFAPCALPPPPPASTAATASLSAQSARAGDRLTVTGTGFEAGEPVTVTLHSTPLVLGTVAAGPDGAFTFTFTLPDVEPGDHRVELVGQTSGRRASAPLVVIGVERSTGTLPATGTTTGSQAATGLALLVLGAALLVFAGRRTESAVTSSLHRTERR